MVNSRVRSLHAMVAQLRAAGVSVEVDPQSYRNGRFARLYDPEATPSRYGSRRAGQALGRGSLSARPLRPPGGCGYAISMSRWCVLFCCLPLLLAQSDDVRAVLTQSQEAWNRGDLAAFASYYDDSPETTFVGREVVRGGVPAILARYRKAYPTRD